MINILIKRMTTVFIIFSVLIVFTACKPDDVPRSDPETNEDNFGYPIPEEYSDFEEALPGAAYPIQEEEFSEPLISEIPLPSEGAGIVYGRLLSLTMDQPVSYSKIYLGTKIEVDPGDEYVISIQDHTSPHSVSTQDGEFLIVDIPPDNYILILVTPINTYPILDINGEYIEMTIKGGERIDLGDVFTNWPDFN